MEMLLKTQTGEQEMSDDDPQMSYMISAWARICKILGPRFAPYLPVVMPTIMKTANLKPEVSTVILFFREIAMNIFSCLFTLFNHFFLLLPGGTFRQR